LNHIGRNVTRTRKSVSESRRRRSGGHVIMESAFTLLPTFALICMFADVGLAMFRWTTLQNAVREGCRYAITFQTSGSSGQDASIGQVVEKYSMGLVKTTDSPQHILVNYYAPTDVNTPLVTGGNVPGNIVEVSVQNVSWAWIAPLSGVFGGFYSTTPIRFSVYSSDILGGYPAGVSSVAR
jgi:Flp pilus assembly protein TadG